MSGDGTRVPGPQPLRWSGVGVPSQAPPERVLAQIERQRERDHVVDAQLPSWSQAMAGRGRGRASAGHRMIRHRSGGDAGPDGGLVPHTDWRLGTLLVGVLAVLIAVAGTGLAWTWHDLRTQSPMVSVAGSGVVVAPATMPHTVLAMLADSNGQLLGGGVIGVDRRTGVCLLTPAQLVVNVQGKGRVSLRDALAGSDQQAGLLGAQLVSTAVGVQVEATWVLTIGELRRLVDIVRGVEVDVPTTITIGSLRVRHGKDQWLSGSQAAAFASLTPEGELDPGARLVRFYEVMESVLARLPAERHALWRALSSAGRDPRTTLADEQYGSWIAALHQQAAGNRLQERVLPLTPMRSGTGWGYGVIGPRLSQVIVGPLAAAKLAGPAGAALHVRLQDAVGSPGVAERARARILVGRLTVVNGGEAVAAAQSQQAKTIFQIPSDSAVDRDHAQSVADLLGVEHPEIVVDAQLSSADVGVVLGPDFLSTTGGRTA